jgi:hypothetical protein
MRSTCEIRTPHLVPNCCFRCKLSCEMRTPLRDTFGSSQGCPYFTRFTVMLSVNNPVTTVQSFLYPCILLFCTVNYFCVLWNLLPNQCSSVLSLYFLHEKGFHPPSALGFKGNKRIVNKWELGAGKHNRSW